MTKKAIARDAVHSIKPGSTIFIGESCAEPQTLVEALIEDRERLKGSRLVECRRFPGASYAALTDYFCMVPLHPTADYREVIRTGKADFYPFRLSDCDSLFAEALHIDVALVQVATPDPRGQCSFSVAAGLTIGAARHADTVIAEVNAQAPRTFGDNSLPEASFDYIVETSRPVLEYVSRPLEEEEVAVARNVVKLIPDGSALTIGIGGICESVLTLLDGKRDLGVHSGMITDGVIEPMKKGVINNRLKNIDKAKTVCGMAFGTEKLFRFIHENPDIQIQPYTYTHDICRIAKLDKFMAINAAIEVDLTGQVAAESVGPVQISTIGGQADFARGACLSKGGLLIIMLSSATRGGKNSKIVASLKPGSIVSTGRYDVHYVVTEYGAAELWGKNLAQRADALISVAHPRFRDELAAVAKQMRA